MQVHHDGLLTVPMDGVDGLTFMLVIAPLGAAEGRVEAGV